MSSSLLAMSSREKFFQISKTKAVGKFKSDMDALEFGIDSENSL
jgi:hypothetical protein